MSLQLSFNLGNANSNTKQRKGSGNVNPTGNVMMNNISIWHGDVGHPLEDPSSGVLDTPSPRRLRRKYQFGEDSSDYVAEEKESGTADQNMEAFPHTTVPQIWAVMQSLGKNGVYT